MSTHCSFARAPRSTERRSAPRGGSTVRAGELREVDRASGTGEQSVAAGPAGDRARRLHARRSSHPGTNVVVLYGPAGVGKSRLADACLDAAEARRPPHRPGAWPARPPPSCRSAPWRRCCPTTWRPRPRPRAVRADPGRVRRARRRRPPRPAGRRRPPARHLLRGAAHPADRGRRGVRGRHDPRRRAGARRGGRLVAQRAAPSAWTSRTSTGRPPRRCCAARSAARSGPTPCAACTWPAAATRCCCGSWSSRRWSPTSSATTRARGASPGAIPPSRRLTELFSARLERPADAARHVLEQLALCAPLGPAELTGDGTPQDLELLERGRPGPGPARRPPPAAGAGPPALRRGAARRAAGAAAPVDPAGRGRPDRGARRPAPGGRPPGGHLAPRRRRHARPRPAPAGRPRRPLRPRLRRGRAAGRACSSGSSPSAEAAVLLGEAHYEMGHFDAAEAVLAAPVPDDTPTAVLDPAGHAAHQEPASGGCATGEGAMQVVTDALAEVGPELRRRPGGREGLGAAVRRAPAGGARRASPPSTPTPPAPGC